jgi:tRNA(Ile)-lysidine synthase
MAVSKKKLPADLAQRVAAFLRQRLGPALTGARLCVGLSGGRDSVVLLALLAELVPELQIQLSAIHVHHGLSAHANDWLAFCQRLCADLKVPLHSASVAVRRDGGEGLEAAARHARYAAFADCPADVLLLAHHRDDLAETMLFNLLRGAGVLGAGGMRDERDIPRSDGRPPLRLLRPLLTTSRTEIEAYAAEAGLAWIDDDSNSDLRFSRNYLRHQIMPALAGHFTRPAASLARAAANFAEAQSLLDELAAGDWQAGPGGRLAIAPFASLSAERGRNLLRYALRSAGATLPDAVALEELRRQLAGVGANPRIKLPAGSWTMYAWQGELWVEPSVVIPWQPQVWAGEPSLAWAGGQLSFTPSLGEGLSQAKLLAAQDVKLPVTVRARAGSDRLQLAANRPHRTLKHLFQEAGVPPWRREYLPLLYVGDQLAWVDGVGVDSAFACAPGEAGLLPVWRR